MFIPFPPLTVVGIDLKWDSSCMWWVIHNEALYMLCVWLTKYCSYIFLQRR